MNPIPDLEDLIALFDGDPRPNVPDDDWRHYWPYTIVHFEAARGGKTVTMRLEPGYEQVGLEITAGDLVETRLKLNRVRTVDVERLHGAEDLFIRFGEDSPVGMVRLRLHPEVYLRWEMRSE